MSKVKRTSLNVLVGITQLVITSAISLIVNRMVIEKLGSDYNGVNATISQTITMLSLLEGGFTTASLVALYKPYVENDTKLINRILSTTRDVFIRVGFLLLGLGLIASFLLPTILRSEMAYQELFFIFSISILPLSFNFGIVLKYRLLFQAAQREYIITIIQMLGTILTQIFSIIVLNMSPNVIYLRIINSFFGILVGIATIVYAKRIFLFASYKEEIDRTLIKGSRDVFVGNVTSFIYTSSTVFFLSLLISTSAASVYAVYNSITILIVTAVSVIVSSPQNALGQTIAEGDEDRTFRIFSMYEYTTIVLVCLLFSTAYSLLIPFIKLYTINVNDINYVDNTIAAMLILTSALQLLHMPSGITINLYGRFKSVKYIQLAAGVLIILSSIVGSLVWGFYGILAAKLLTGLFLTIVEIYYVRVKIFNRGTKRLSKTLFANAIPSTIISLVLYRMTSPFIIDVTTFILYGIINTLSIIILLILINVIYLRDESKELLAYLRSMLGGR